MQMMSACGVMCSDCPAFHAAEKGETYQQQVVEAWHRIYGLNETSKQINCSGCLGMDEELFYTSRTCQARRCCISKGYRSCAECSVEKCPELEKAQAVWDEVPLLKDKLSEDDFKIYARPYCDHRKRLAEARSS